MFEIATYSDTTMLARAAAERFASLGLQYLADYGQFSVALAGGSTPRAMYSLLAQEDFGTDLDWSKIHVFWGDERCVPPGDPQSNFRMAQEALLDHVDIDAGNIHRFSCELSHDQAAAVYDQDLRTFFGASQTGHFDLILLGMGSDGHTASLFPGLPAVEETEKWVVSHYVDKLNAWRVSLTPVVINDAANIIFLVAGSNKAECLQQVLSGPFQPQITPAQIVQPSHGRVMWMVDDAAASLFQDT